MTETVLQSQAFTLKGRLYTLTVLTLLDTEWESFNHQLGEVIAKAPRLFNQTPVILDCSGIDINAIDLSIYIQTLRSHGFVPVALQGADETLETYATSHQLAILNASSNYDRPINEKSKPATPKTTSSKTKTVTTPVRSGQQVVSQGDLIVAASVGHGAELLAEGNIHVYGALRGRALAGISGNKNARIFCQSLEAELLSIAGFYRLSDSLEFKSTPCQILLEDDRILIERL